MSSEEADTQALQAIRIARTSLASGDVEKARRMAEKATRLSASASIAAHAAEILASLNNPRSSSASSAPRDERQRRSISPESSRAASDRAYTPEQAAEAKRICSMSNYYEILGVSRSATEKEIKNAYRKLALAFHPDKNAAPQSEEAFKKISKAYQTLSDERKRNVYNQSGERDESEIPQQRR